MMRTHAFTAVLAFAVAVLSAIFAFVRDGAASQASAFVAVMCLAICITQITFYERVQARLNAAQGSKTDV
jgi:predicted membrane channel-forming protein YqfA (hemolysin III family)